MKFFTFVLLATLVALSIGDSEVKEPKPVEDLSALEDDNDDGAQLKMLEQDASVPNKDEVTQDPNGDDKGEVTQDPNGDDKDEGSEMAPICRTNKVALDKHINSVISQRLSSRPRKNT